MESGTLVHIEIKCSVNLFGYTKSIARVMFYVKYERIPKRFITVERSFGCQRRKISRTLTLCAATVSDETKYLEIFDFSIEFPSRRVHRCQENFRLLANRQGIILSGIFLPGVSRRHRRRRYRGTVTIVDVKVTREGGKKSETE